MADSMGDYFRKIMAADIVLSDDTGNCLRKWLNLLNITQTEISEHLSISSSVISDYLGNRRKSPGILWIRNYINALIELEEASGLSTLAVLAPLIERIGTIDPIITAMQFSAPISLISFSKALEATIVFPTKEEYDLETYILGVLGVNARKILEIRSSDLKGNLLETTSKTAIIFANTQTGRGIFSFLPINDPIQTPIWVFPEKRINLSVIKASVKRLQKAKAVILISKLNSVEKMITSLSSSYCV